MREILFRGKRVDGYGWIYGGLIYDEAERNQPRIVIEREFSTGTFFHAQAPRVMRDTVGQFTGLTDKNGKKIFEGDILEDILCGDKERYVVVFDEYLRYMITNRKSNYLLSRNNKDMEVIGNIYDNPELLEVK